mmetsp:Transcript_114099/g.368595  ORF Transcript_114099/g.368595 Transcript_114099/m.368595 type:complete len:284 (-) Transcript_114099:659-1510(-)
MGQRGSRRLVEPHLRRKGHLVRERPGQVPGGGAGAGGPGVPRLRGLLALGEVQGCGGHARLAEAWHRHPERLALHWQAGQPGRGRVLGQGLGLRAGPRGRAGPRRVAAGRHPLRAHGLGHEAARACGGLRGAKHREGPPGLQRAQLSGAGQPLASGGCGPVAALGAAGREERHRHAGEPGCELPPPERPDRLAPGLLRCLHKLQGRRHRLPLVHVLRQVAQGPHRPLPRLRQAPVAHGVRLLGRRLARAAAHVRADGVHEGGDPHAGARSGHPDVLLVQLLRG